MTSDISDKINKIKKLTLYENFLAETEKLIKMVSMDDPSLLKFRKNIGSLSKNIMDEVNENERFFVNLISYIQGNSKFYTHCLNSAIFSALFCLNLNIEEKKSVNVITAALLHDIGKLKFGGSITKKYILPNDNSRNIKMMHPMWGKRLILNHLRLSEEIAGLVEHHHEHADGTGFPRKLAGDQLSIFNNIMTISNLLELVLQKLEYAGIAPFTKFIEMMLNKHPKKFNLIMRRAITDIFGLKKENRKFKRYKISKEGYVESQESKIRYPCQVVDVSAGGMKIITETPLPHKGFYKVTLMLTGNLFIKDKNCKILWDQKGTKQNEYGIEFYVPDETLMDNILAVLKNA